MTLAALLLAALATVACGPTMAPETHVPDSKLIVHATLLDGRGGEPVQDAFVRIEGERIVEVGRGVPRFSRHAAVIDAGGRWLLPGLIDMHAHLLIPRCAENADGSPIFDRALSELALGQMLDFGITTVRSPATPTIAGLALRDDLNSGRTRGPFAFAAAELINDNSASEPQLRKIVQDAVRYRPDFFKAYSALSPASVAVIVEEAHRHGLPVIGHLQRTSWVEGLDLGVDQLTHAVDWSDQSLPAAARADYRAAMATGRGFSPRLRWLELVEPDGAEQRRIRAALVSRKVPVDPTLIAFDAKFSRPESARYRANPHVARIAALRDDWQACSNDPTGGWTSADFDRWERVRPKLLEIVRRYHQAGVPLTVGTDFTNPWIIPGESIHQELELLAEAGIPPAAILRMAGANAAEALGSADVGIVAPGRRADLILLSRNPLADIRNSRSRLWVMQAGRIVYRAAGRG